MIHALSDSIQKLIRNLMNQPFLLIILFIIYRKTHRHRNSDKRISSKVITFKFRSNRIFENEINVNVRIL